MLATLQIKGIILINMELVYLDNIFVEIRLDVTGR